MVCFFLRLAGFRQAVTSSLARIDDRSARKTLFLVLDTSGQKHDRGSKRERDVSPTQIVYVERCVAQMDGWSDVDDSVWVCGRMPRGRGS